MGNNQCCCANDTKANEMVDTPAVATLTAAKEEEVGLKASADIAPPAAVAAAKEPEVPVQVPPPPSAPVVPEAKEEAKVNKATKDGPKEFTITLRKTPDNSRLGLTVDIANSVCMVVDKVNGGLLAEWNQKNPDLEVKPGDRVMTVNGQSGDAVELTQVCKQDDVLEMKIVREKRD
mmetsp:Transcript_25921/g.41638  ORF Transcript_25921/g.41638 Transcript_25921/m.41638 type:complete len:176 (-) Transcript_25921:64-591(-)